MTEKNPLDPMAWFRDMLGEWEKATNEIGGKIGATPEFSKAMNQMNTAQMTMRNAMHEATAKALAAANMPSREDVAALGERMGAVEAQLARIEALLSGGAPVAPDRPKPKRTKKPPSAK